MSQPATYEAAMFSLMQTRLKHDAASTDRDRVMGVLTAYLAAIESTLHMLSEGQITDAGALRVITRHTAEVRHGL